MSVSAVGYLPLIFTFVVCFCTNSIPALSDNNATDELVNEVCQNTTISDFCRTVIYSNPLAKNADRFTLAYIVFREAYTSTSNVTDHIASWIETTKVGYKDETLVGMKNCLRFYRWAVHSLGEALDNIYSDTYYELDRSAANAEGYARDCEASFNGRPSPMAVNNQDLIKYSKVCLAVSQLFPYD
ncbi:pectinesterase inhibitor-like [Primulina eburnea]|uniref:pectinesterase inhibitor-like n=1 Tax=Primulina eburnea TaxID=1245227 RepID=UPI003C6BDD0B